MPSSSEKRGYRLAALGVGVVLLAIALALSQIRSPWSERNWRTDLETVKRLDHLADAIDCHWLTTGAVPEGLAQLADMTVVLKSEPTVCNRVSTTLDAAWIERQCRDCAYEALDAGRYRLCAEMRADMTATDDQGLGPYQRVSPGRRDWRHEPGRTCFEFTARERP